MKTEKYLFSAGTFHIAVGCGITFVAGRRRQMNNYFMSL